MAEARLCTGDCREILKTLPSGSVHCCVTSPPYYSLRNYGLLPSAWGGDPVCDHSWETREHNPQPHGDDGHSGGLEGGTNTQAATRIGMVQSAFCARCGAWRGQLGLEPTVELYVAHLVEVFCEVKRVLRSDGTFWLNIGDSYASGKGTCFNPGGGERSLGKERKEAGTHPLDRGSVVTLRQSGLKPKDLCMIPARLALALQADGWWLRQEIVWQKPNCLPESVQDRCTRSHEMIYMLTKSPRYYYDAEAIKEPAKATTVARAKGGTWHNPEERPDVGFPGQPNRSTAAINRGIRDRVLGGDQVMVNKRDVWTISTTAFRGSHYAVFPPKLVEPCILAGTSQEGCCPSCGKPWVRVVERTDVIDPSAKGSRFDLGKTGINGNGRTQQGERYVKQTVGWRPGCACGGDPVPCVVLDPFSGVGTTGLVALGLGRDYIGIEMKEEYSEMARERLGQKLGPFCALASDYK